jgi:hypothetical protein
MITEKDRAALRRGASCDWRAQLPRERRKGAHDPGLPTQVHHVRYDWRSGEDDQSGMRARVNEQIF